MILMEQNYVELSGVVDVLEVCLLTASYMEEKGYPKWKSVQRVVEKAEPAVFKSYFKTWKEPTEQSGLGRIFNERQIAASKL